MLHIDGARSSRMLATNYEKSIKFSQGVPENKGVLITRDLEEFEQKCREKITG